MRAERISAVSTSSNVFRNGPLMKA